MKTIAFVLVITAALVSLSHRAQSQAPAFVACLSMSANDNATLTSQINAALASGYQPQGGLAIAYNGTIVKLGVLVCK